MFSKSLFISTQLKPKALRCILKQIWYIREKGEEVKGSSIARLLNVKQPSVVQMLHKLNEDNLVEYTKGRI
jgi:DtxR family Mn-dependent transcriptional regulator